MRVLGVDPGLTRCGLGVVEGEARALRMVAVGVVRTSAERDTGDRLAYVQDELDAWLDRFTPDVIALERVYAAEHVPTVMTTAQVSGLVLLAGARRGLPVVLHTPTEVKAAVTGSGRADKAQITTMVTRILSLTEAPKPADAADALALAICHQWRGAGNTRRALAAASERARLRSVAGA
ncbi:crossover junction endodeoxyribonuclease RuvC [Janibacter limosus]|uniref:Crossover junction endodeoxyribonuclease RuvC n=1 Tax=Janibacter limosus TaxID=53458 RepID=A0A4P6MT57_9MICO|nr:crossover junction endodeoxyribonuclease RuvC [Janibacter limosus]QBF45922.1 crossover junction endodeoxyribonuclease RuvC [Janibacter limosus]